MSILLHLHGDLRWLVAAVVVALIAVSTAASVQRRTIGALHVLARALAILLTLQFLVGAVLLVYDAVQAGWSVAALRLPLEHAVTMLVAVALSHGLPRWARTPTGAVRVLVATVGIAVLVFLGVVRLRGVGYWLP